MNIDEIIQLINAVNKSNLTKFKYSNEKDTVEFEINKEINPVQASNVIVKSSAVNIEETNALTSSENDDVKAVIKSPIVGTFYAARKEGAEPLIKVGDTVKKGQIIGIIEAMKLMNEIEATADGIVEEILVENGELVEYNQPLVRVK